MDGLFDSAWIKCAGAGRHGNALKRSLNAYLKGLNDHGPAALRREYHPKRHCISVMVDTDAFAPPAIVSAQFADVVHNYRCCLDHLAWALVTRGRTPPDQLTAKQRRNVYFPIAQTRAQYKAALLKRPGILPADEAIIRARQPYRESKRIRPHHVFSILNRLDDNDKHRKIEPVIAVPFGAAVRVLQAQDCTVTRIPRQERRVALKKDAEVCRVFVRKTGPNPDVDVDMRMTPIPVVHETLSVIDWLDETEGHIIRMLLRFAGPPDSIKDGSFD